MLQQKNPDLKEQILSNSIFKVPKMGKFIETESRFGAMQGREMVLQVKVFAPQVWKAEFESQTLRIQWAYHL